MKGARGRSTCQEIAAWTADLTTGDIPDDVLDLARAQRRSVLAAIAVASGDDVFRRVAASLTSRASGTVPLPGTDATGSVEEAVYLAAMGSITLDFDDYGCFGHAGHSAVPVPLLLAAETGADGATQLAAQVAADEVALRLGGMCLLGAQNGQLWTFPHAAAAAVAAARVFGLDADRTAHALALSLAQAPRAVAPALAAPDSKLLLAAEPVRLGLRAARLAADGVTGPLDVLDHPEGFPSAFADPPLRGALRGLGHGWALRTLSVKPVPGCAYLTAVVEALESLGPPHAGEIESVVVEGALPTIVMEHLSAPYTGSGPSAGAPTPVTIGFSARWTAAILLHHGDVSPPRFREDALAEHAASLRDLASRIEVRHDAGLSAACARGFADAIPLREVVAEAGAGGLLGALRRTAGQHLGTSVGEVARLLPRLLRDRGSGGASTWWDPEALDRFEMTLPARVRVRHRSGREQITSVLVPRGAAGHPTAPPTLVAREKLAVHGPARWREGTQTIDEAVDHDESDLYKLL